MPFKPSDSDAIVVRNWAFGRERGGIVEVEVTVILVINERRQDQDDGSVSLLATGQFREFQHTLIMTYMSLRDKTPARSTVQVNVRTQLVRIRRSIASRFLPFPRRLCSGIDKNAVAPKMRRIPASWINHPRFRAGVVMMQTQIRSSTNMGHTSRLIRKLCEAWWRMKSPSGTDRKFG